MKLRCKLARTASVALVLSVIVVVTPAGAVPPGAQQADAVLVPGEVPAANCGPGSRPENGVQGQIPRVDRRSGRSRQGYECNLERVGQYQGLGAGVISARYGDCVFIGSFPTTYLRLDPGVVVLDVSNPARPRRVTTLRSSAMAMGTLESMKVHEGRALLAAVGLNAVEIGALVFDIYDISDCTRPKLLNGIGGTSFTAPVAVVGHEGGFAPDGRTYYSASATGGWVSAIDVADPARPRAVWNGSVGPSNHGFSISADGNRMYGSTLTPGGVQVLDVSDIQARRAFPQVREISRVQWLDGLLTQHSIPFTTDGHPYLAVVDEGGGGGVRIVDLADEANPRVVRQLRLAINRPENRSLRIADTGGNGVFGYDAHYCSIDRPTDPTALACSYFNSGVRVFDVRDPLAPNEIAYFDPPGVGGGPEQLLRLPNSIHPVISFLPPLVDPLSIGAENLVGALRPDMSTDLCLSPPWFVGEGQLWVACSDNGFLALEFTNDAYGPP